MRCGLCIFPAAGWCLRAAAAHGFQLVAAGLDGKDELPLTYMPASAIPADVLADGRILFEAAYPLGSGNTPELFLVYSDGSGVESYRCDHGPRLRPLGRASTRVRRCGVHARGFAGAVYVAAGA